jgi:hypothetical protein
MPAVPATPAPASEMAEIPPDLRSVHAICRMRRHRFLDWIGREEDERTEARGSTVVRGDPT